MACKSCFGRHEMDGKFMRMLQSLREEMPGPLRFGFSVKITMRWFPQRVETALTPWLESLIFTYPGNWSWCFKTESPSELLYSVIDIVLGAFQTFHPWRYHYLLFNFQMAWEVIEKQDDYEFAYRWFHSKQKAENFCLGQIAGKL